MSRLRSLGVRSTKVNGDVAALHAATSLGPDWMPYGVTTCAPSCTGTHGGRYDDSWTVWTPMTCDLDPSTDGTAACPDGCNSLQSTYAGGCPAGSSPIANAATFIGNDACACCTATASLTRNAAGDCVNSTAPWDWVLCDGACVPRDSCDVAGDEQQCPFV